MTRDELVALKNAVLHINKPMHEFIIDGDSFSCEWKGDHFEWTSPSGCVYTLTAQEVIRYIGDGENIKHILYDFSRDYEVDEDEY